MFGSRMLLVSPSIRPEELLELVGKAKRRGANVHGGKTQAVVETYRSQVKRRTLLDLQRRNASHI